MTADHISGGSGTLGCDASALLRCHGRDIRDHEPCHNERVVQLHSREQRTGTVRSQAASGWGRVPVVPGYQVRSEDLEAITADVPLTRGLGRAYGDAALPAPGDARIAGSTLADRVLALRSGDRRHHGRSRIVARRTVPGVTAEGLVHAGHARHPLRNLGGMVAADVHGKNHHVDGCIRPSRRRMQLRVADGRVVTCSRDEYPDLFLATIGGMGLTGHILEVTFRLVRVPRRGFTRSRCGSRTSTRSWRL